MNNKYSKIICYSFIFFFYVFTHICHLKLKFLHLYHQDSQPMCSNHRNQVIETVRVQASSACLIPSSFVGQGSTFSCFFFKFQQFSLMYFYKCFKLR